MCPRTPSLPLYSPSPLLPKSNPMISSAWNGAGSCGRPPRINPLHAPRQFLSMGNGLHSSSLTLPEFQKADSKQLLIREERNETKEEPRNSLLTPNFVHKNSSPETTREFEALTMSHPFSLINPAKHLPLLQTLTRWYVGPLCASGVELVQQHYFHFLTSKWLAAFLPPHSSLFPSNRWNTFQICKQFCKYCV